MAAAGHWVPRSEAQQFHQSMDRQEDDLFLRIQGVPEEYLSLDMKKIGAAQQYMKTYRMLFCT